MGGVVAACINESLVGLRIAAEGQAIIGLAERLLAFDIELADQVFITIFDPPACSERDSGGQSAFDTPD